MVFWTFKKANWIILTINRSWKQNFLQPHRQYCRKHYRNVCRQYASKHFETDFEYSHNWINYYNSDSYLKSIMRGLPKPEDYSRRYVCPGKTMKLKDRKQWLIFRGKNLVTMQKARKFFTLKTNHCLRSFSFIVFPGHTYRRE